jgi:hypothetical protein
MKDGTRLPADSEERAHALAFDWQLLSFRQTAEWGNRTLQGSFVRLRIPLQINYNDHCGDLLESCVRLYNLRAHKVSYNQICSVYMPIWKANGQEEIWNHFGGMLFSDQRRNDRVQRFHMVSVYE